MNIGGRRNIQYCSLQRLGKLRDNPASELSSAKEQLLIGCMTTSVYLGRYINI